VREDLFEMTCHTAVEVSLPRRAKVSSLAQSSIAKRFILLYNVGR
jgi:hypothetical protein